MRKIKEIENEMNLPVSLQEIAVTLTTAGGDVKFKNVGIVFNQVLDYTDSEGSVCLELNRKQAMKLAKYLKEYAGGTLTGKSESGK